LGPDFQRREKGEGKREGRGRVVERKMRGSEGKGGEGPPLNYFGLQQPLLLKWVINSELL